MAKDDELELDTVKSSGGGKGKIIIILVAAILLTTGSVLGVLFFTGNLGAGGGSEQAESGGKEEEAKPVEVKQAFYLDLQPAFVVNFEDQTHATYLQVEMQLMARDKLVLDTVTKHSPVIRNNILLILSAQKFDQVKTRQGKEALQKTILESVQQTVLEATKGQQSEDEKKSGNKSKPANVEQVYFTSFIMQ